MPPQHLSRSVRRDLRQASERTRRVRRSERLRSLRRQDADSIRLKRTERCSEKLGRRELVVSHLQLADAIAHRYAGRPQDADDLRQVAYLGLVKAAERFDPERSDDFASFAVPTIAGEIKRHFRDNCWFVRPPRSLQELKSTVEHEVPRMAQQLGRDPSRGEIAERVGEPAERIDEAIGCSRAMHPMSLDAPVSTADEHTAFGDTIDSGDRALERAEQVQSLRRACRELPPRERLIIYRRFYEERTQSEIAQEIGVTQMQVSRLLTSTLARLRSLLGGAEWFAA
ncbi:sigma-70 family RNA polymerase sigma factor [Humibacter sp.]|uniref:sigma-70 family RNA polymerase sigma factor n=1 Tax=Humibacter sp. TaxID=1940291 RepID=UPI003F7F1D4A